MAVLFLILCCCFELDMVVREGAVIFLFLVCIFVFQLCQYHFYDNSPLLSSSFVGGVFTFQMKCFFFLCSFLVYALEGTFV